MKKTIYLIAVASMLSSCGIYTNYHKQEAVPENLYGEEVTIDTTSVSLGERGWRELFTDPQLQALIERGLQNNTDLQSARLRVEQAEASMLSAKLSYLPSFALTPEGSLASFDKAKAVKTYQLPVVASWQLDFFGGIRNNKKQAKAVYEQSQDYRQAVQTGVISGIANLYYTLRMLDEQLAISEQTEHSWQETVDAMRAMMKAGMANEAAVSQLEAAFYGTNAARSSFWPNITLSGSAGWTNSVGDAIINPGKFLAAAIGSLTQPIFAQGQLAARYKIAKASQEQASLAFLQALLNAGAEVNEALVACETSRRKSVLIAEQVAALEKAYESTSLLMQHGNITYLDVLTAQQSLLGARLQQSANRFMEIQSVISLYQALGGGRN